MRIRTSLSIVVLVGAFVAIPLYFINRPERAAEIPVSGNAAALPPAADVDVRELYCVQSTPATGVIVNTGAGCSNQAESTRVLAPTVTVTGQPDALVITGSDP